MQKKAQRSFSLSAKAYFVLQYRLINRHLRDNVLPIAAAYPILVIVFILFSTFLFNRSTFAEYPD